MALPPPPHLKRKIEQHDTKHRERDRKKTEKRRAELAQQLKDHALLKNEPADIVEAARRIQREKRCVLKEAIYLARAQVYQPRSTATVTTCVNISNSLTTSSGFYIYNNYT